MSSILTLAKYHELLFSWTMRTIRARYQQTVLGGIWAILQPAASAAIFTVIFTRFIPVDTGDIPYVVFSYSTMVPWVLFSASIPDMVEALVANMNLVTKIYFPREILILAVLLARLMDFVIASSVLILLMIIQSMPVFTVNWLFLPVIIVTQLALMLGLGLIGSALNVFYRDIKHIIPLGLQLWFFATPIIYPVTMVPEGLRPYYFLNPMAGIIEAYRAVLLYSTPPGNYFYLSMFVGGFLFLVGYWFFKELIQICGYYIIVMNPSIEFLNVSKKYRIGGAAFNFRSLLSSLKGGKEQPHHWAVKDVSFELSTGKSMGIIGPNGAGKTTILKLLSRVTYPNSGKIKMNGRFSALIELGAGFHPELTGRENVYLNGSILGMDRAEINKRFDQIVEFSGIEKYLETPVKRYSSGMYARLGYSVAAHVDPEILLVDEVLAVGDMAFQKKCFDHMRQLIKDGTTLIFVSHNLRAIQRVCDNCIVMYRGNKVFEGDSANGVAEYSNLLREAATEYNQVDGLIERGISQRILTHAAKIEEVEVLNESGQTAISYNSGEKILVRAKVNFYQDAPSPVFACSIRRPDGQVVYDFTTNWAEIETPDFEAKTTAIIEYPMELNLAAGTYHLGVNLAYHDLSRYYDRLDRFLDFVVMGGNGAQGVANLKAEFRIANIETDPSLDGGS